MARTAWRSASQASGAGGGLPGACSPAHIGVQLDQVPPGAVQQRVEHQTEGNLAGEERGMRREAPQGPQAQLP